MDIFYSLLGSRIIFVLGVINFVTAIAIVFSCRCLPTSRVFKFMTRNKPFQKFYKLHCYLWWIFWPAVLAHVFFTFVRLGIPF